MSIDNGKERLDVDQKVVALFAFGIVCALLLILIVNISINTASGIRAYVGWRGNVDQGTKRIGYSPHQFYPY